LCGHNFPFSSTFEPSVRPHQAAHDLPFFLYANSVFAAADQGHVVAKEPNLGVVKAAVAFFRGRVVLYSLSFIVGRASRSGALKIVSEERFGNPFLFLLAAILRLGTFHFDHSLGNGIVL
jgi:hypothetical protein